MSALRLPQNLFSALDFITASSDDRVATLELFRGFSLTHATGLATEFQT